MQKVRLLVHQSTVAPVMRLLQRRGVLELTEVKQDERLTVHNHGDYPFEHASGKLSFAVALLSRYAPRRRSLSALRTGGKILTTREEIDHLAESVPYEEITARLESAEDERNRSEARLVEIVETKKLLEPWCSVDAPLNRIWQTAYTKTIALELTAEVRENLDARLRDVLGHSRFALHAVTKRIATLTVAREDADSVEQVIEELVIEKVVVPETDMLPAHAYAALIQEEKEQYEVHARAVAAIQNELPHLRELTILNDAIRWRKEKHAIIAATPATKTTLVFEGWCPKRELGGIQEAVYGVSPYADLSAIEMNEDEQPPVEIKNGPLIAPFESITRLYGLPASNDIDPTRFLAGFFFIFFGLALTDVGYGLFLAIVTLAALLFFKALSTGTRQLLWLLFAGGIASLIAGLFFGGYLGIDAALLPEWARSLQRFDPIASPLPVLYLALALGVVQVLFGLMLNIYAAARRNDALNGLLDSGPWILLFLALILWGGASTGFVTFGSSALFVICIYVALGLIVLTQGRREKGIIPKALKGVLSLYDSVQYFSDVLSYSRILALGLATTALAFAVNLIAVLVNDMVPVVGGVLMVIILIVGHLFNIGVNVLGAFIHSARLQFVEFFGKFITGSGRTFAPLRQEQKSIIIRE